MADDSTLELDARGNAVRSSTRARVWLAAGLSGTLALVLVYWASGTPVHQVGLLDLDAAGRAPDPRAGEGEAGATLRQCLISGSVFEHAGGQPISGAIVGLTPTPPGASRAHPRTERSPIAVTDVEGHWTVAVAGAGPFTLGVAAMGFVPRTVRLVEACRVGGRASTETALRRGGVVVTGFARGAGSEPMAEVLVSAERVAPGGAVRADEGRFAAFSDTRGAYWLQLDPGDYRFEASRSGQVTAGRPPVSIRSPRNRVDFMLFPAASVSGRVLNRADGTGVPDAVVRAVGEPAARLGMSAWRAFAVRTGATGEFIIDGLKPGAIELAASSGDLTSKEPTTVPLRMAERVAGVKVWVDRGRRVSGFVVRRGDETQRISGVWVDARDLDTGVSVSALWSSTPDGYFEIVGLHPGTYALDVEGERILPQATGESIAVGDADIRDRLLEIDPGVTLSGHLDPATEASVRLEWLSDDVGIAGSAVPVRADAVAFLAGGRGDFKFEGVPRGNLALIAEASDGRVGKARVEVQDRDQKGIVIHLERLASISGRVIDTMGEPAWDASVMVTLAAPTRSMLDAIELVGCGHVPMRSAKERPVLFSQWRTPFFRYVSTKPDGTFEVHGLGPGKYDLTVYGSSGHLAWGSPVTEGGPDLPLVVGIGATEAKAGIILTVEACRGALSGMVTDGRGMSVPQAWVTVSSQDHQPLAFDDRSERLAVTNADGRFTVANLCGRQFEVKAWTSSGALQARRVGVREGASVTLKLERLSTLHGTVSSRGVPVVEYLLSLMGPLAWRRRIHSADGSYRLPRLDPGQYELVVETDDGYAFVSTELTPGATREVNPHLVPWTSLRGRLVNGRKQPQSAAKVSLFFVPSFRGQGGVSRIRRTTTDTQGRVELARVMGHQAHLSFESVEGDLLPPALDTAPWVDLGPWSGPELDLGSIEIHGDESGD
jgi:hypothetical protein